MDENVKKKGGSIMNKIVDYFKSRKDVAVRFLFTLLFFIVFEIIKIIIEVVVLFQFVFLLFKLKPNQSIKNFSNKVAVYGYKILRYISFNEKPLPYPFTDFPSEIDPPDETMTFEKQTTDE